MKSLMPAAGAAERKFLGPAYGSPAAGSGPFVTLPTSMPPPVHDCARQDCVLVPGPKVKPARTTRTHAHLGKALFTISPRKMRCLTRFGAMCQISWRSSVCASFRLGVKAHARTPYMQADTTIRMGKSRCGTWMVRLGDTRFASWCYLERQGPVTAPAIVDVYRHA